MSESAGDSAGLAVNQVHLGDCVAGMRAMPAGSVDLVFADPPFNIGYEYDVYDDRREHEHYLEWSREWISAVRDVLKPEGTFWLAIGDEYAADLKLISQSLGFHCRSWVIWYYTFGVNCARKFSRSHAHLFHFVKDPERFTFRSEAPENRLPSARQLVYRDRRANPKGRLPDDTWILRPQDLGDCFTTREDTWYFPRVAGTFAERAGYHGCQMPEQLLARVIRVSSEEGDLVLDPFAGSSSTLVVAKKLGRRHVGFDMSPEYVTRGMERLANTRRGDRLEGAPEPLLSAPSTGEGRTLTGVQVRSSLPTRQRVRPKSLPLFGIDEEAEEQAREAVESQTIAGLLAAFRDTRQGHSLDRVILDPDLHTRLVARCRDLGLPGDVRSWNLRLLAARRSGLLVDDPTQAPTEWDATRADAWLDGVEIALAHTLTDQIPDLEELFCEPASIARFDELARRMAPGATLLEYRWSALRLVGALKTARTRAVAYEPPRFEAPADASELDAALNSGRIANSPGVYCVSLVDGTPLYAGHSRQLAKRLRARFDAAHCDSLWGPRNDLRWTWSPIAGELDDLLAYQCLLVQASEPKFNLSV